MTWSAVIVTDSNGTALGEIPDLKDRRISYRLRKSTAGGFAVPLRHKLADALLEGDVIVKLYENVDGIDVLRVSAPVQAAEEVVQGERATVAVTYASPSSELGDRLCGKSTTGVSFSAGTQRGDAAAQLLDTTNAEAPTLLRRGTIGATGALPAGGVGPWRYKPISEAWQELYSPLDGYDWEDRPVEPAIDATGPYCGLLDIWAAKGGQPDGVIFEYGTGRHNVKGYRRPVTRQGMANQVFSLPPGFPDNIAAGDTVLSKNDPTSIGTYRLREQVIGSDISVAALRQQLVDEHVRVRKTPRQVIKIDPQPAGFRLAGGRKVHVPRFKVDFDTGDVVTFRAVKYGRVRFDGLVRVFGADIALSDTGVATVSPILELEG